MDCFIVDAIRTPRGRGKKDGSLHRVTSLNLIKGLLQTIRTRYPLVQTACDDMILGCVMPVGEQGANIARSALLAAKYPESIPGMQINRFCSSGLDAVAISASRIASNQANLMLAGGVESMSRVPMMSDGGAIMFDPQVAYAQQIVPQGISADLIATLHKFSREELDNFAIRSHQRAAKALQNGEFHQSVIPVKNVLDEVLLDYDEAIRPDCNLNDLAKLQPSFVSIGKMGGFAKSCIQKYPQIETLKHFHHAGNSSAISDGAALVLLANEKTLNNSDLNPKAQILGYATYALDPTIMLTAPSESSKRLLDKLGLSLDDIDVIEINEAFSSVALYYMKALDIDDSRVNLNGGAIAMGHPLGATGAIILGTAVDLLISRKKRLGLISLCTASGMGVSMVIKNMEY